MNILKIIFLIIFWIFLLIVFIFMCGYFIIVDFNYPEGETLKIDFYIHASIVILLFIVFVYYTVYLFKEIKKSIKN